MLELEPGCPVDVDTCTPASFPPRALSTDVTGADAMVSPSTAVTDPVMASRFVEP